MPSGGVLPPAPVRAPGSALGSRPRLARSSAQVPRVHPRSGVRGKSPLCRLGVTGGNSSLTLCRRRTGKPDPRGRLPCRCNKLGPLAPVTRWFHELSAPPGGPHRCRSSGSFDGIRSLGEFVSTAGGWGKILRRESHLNGPPDQSFPGIRQPNRLLSPRLSSRCSRSPRRRSASPGPTRPPGLLSP